MQIHIFYLKGFHSSKYVWTSQQAEANLTKLWPLLLGTQIYCLNGTDPEGQEVRYGLSFDPGSKEYFRIDPKSGNITLVEQLDREVKAWEEIRVEKIINLTLNFNI